MVTEQAWFYVTMVTEEAWFFVTMVTETNKPVGVNSFDYLWSRQGRTEINRAKHRVLIGQKVKC